MNRQPGVGIQTMKHPPSSQSAGTGDVRFSDLGDCEPLPAPKPAPGKEEGSQLRLGNLGVWRCSLPPALSSTGLSKY